MKALNNNLEHFPLIPRILLAIWAVILALLPVPAMWSIALFGLRLRRPHPALRRLVRQPGFVAAGAVTLVGAVRLAGCLKLIVRVLGNCTYTLWCAKDNQSTRIAPRKMSPFGRRKSLANSAFRSATSGWFLRTAS